LALLGSLVPDQVRRMILKAEFTFTKLVSDGFHFVLSAKVLNFKDVCKCIFALIIKVSFVRVAFKSNETYTCNVHLCDTGGIIAASWAILKCMGQDGYLDMARKLMAVTDHLKREINAMEVNTCKFVRDYSYCLCQSCMYKHILNNLSILLSQGELKYHELLCRCFVVHAT